MQISSTAQQRDCSPNRQPNENLCLHFVRLFTSQEWERYMVHGGNCTHLIWLIQEWRKDGERDFRFVTTSNFCLHSILFHLFCGPQRQTMVCRQTSNEHYLLKVLSLRLCAGILRLLADEALAITMRDKYECNSLFADCIWPVLEPT